MCTHTTNQQRYYEEEKGRVRYLNTEQNHCQKKVVIKERWSLIRGPENKLYCVSLQ